MPIRFGINPDLDLLVYVFDGPLSAKDYFHAYKTAYGDERRHHGMKVFMDLTNAELDFETADFWEGIAIVRTNRDSGFDPDHVAILASNSSMQYLADTIKFLADELPMHLSVFHNPLDAISWLDLTKKESDVLQFWSNLKTEKM
jgi:hypothetical protein